MHIVIFICLTEPYEVLILHTLRMIQMKNHKRCCLSLLMVALMAFSLGSFTQILAQEKPPEKPPEGPPWWKEKQFNGTFIHWNTEQDVWEDSWSWINQAWEFGPYPTFAIFLLNGTEVTDANCVPLGEPFEVVIDVKKTIFMGNMTLGRAGLNWHTDLKTEHGESSGYAHCRMVYVNQIVTPYWNESDTWHIESFVFNESEVLAPPGQPPPPMEKGGEVSFYEFDEDMSKVTETTEMWRIEIIGSLDAEKTPVGPFWVDLEVTDSWDNWIDFGYSAWAGKVSPHRMVAVGKPGFVFGGFKDTWTFEKLDMENKSVHSVSRGALWKMRVNVTSADLVNVTLALDLDWGVKTIVNVTRQYRTSVTEQGGWVYNETSGTYYWNSTVEVTRSEERYGEHPEERWTHVPHENWVNVTRHYWDPVTGEDKTETMTQFEPERLFLTYDYATDTFTVRQGYSYWSYDPELHREMEYLILHPVNASDPTTRVYNLSISHCSYRQIAPDSHVIEFVGSFSNTTFSDKDVYWIHEPIVYNKYDRVWANWETITPGDLEIAVDQLWAVTTIIDKNGQEVKWRMFQVDPSEFFIIQSKLEGANVRYTDIDGVGVIFRTGEGKWDSKNENYWSDVEIRLVYDRTTGELSSTTYNWTRRERYVYGPHKGWALVNTTDWHQEYNETTGEWEWVKSPYLLWNETIITDWHWERLILNQTEYRRDPNSTTAWINREEKWVPDQDPAFVMDTAYATLNSADISLIEGVVIAKMNITFSSEAPQRNYWWEVGFKNMTYGPDYSQGWGEHTVKEWTSDYVYYVNGTATGNEPWYVTSPSTPLCTRYNGTKYKLEETPYITIGNNDLLVKGRTHYDWWSGEDRTEYLFRDPYDPVIGKEPRYYELMNGTKIYVTEAYKVLIRTLQLNDTKAYRFVGTERVSVPNGTVFTTFMDRAVADWSREYWEEGGYRVVPYYYELLNGTRIYRNDEFYQLPNGTTIYRNGGFEKQEYNMTTNRWNLSYPVYTEENVTSLLVDRAGRGVALNYTRVVLLREHDSWWQTLPDGKGYYLVMRNGTRIIYYGSTPPWNVPEQERIVTINGVNYQVGWPEEYYNGTYEGESFLIRGGGWEGYVHPFYHTKIGGVMYEMPYPGAMAMSWWDLEGIESQGRKLKTVMSFTVDGTKYRLYLSADKRNYYIIVNGIQTVVDWPKKDAGLYYAEINGVEQWDLTQVGWVLQLGTSEDRSGQFNAVQSFTTQTGYNPAERAWSEHNRYGYDRENATLYLEDLDGVRYDLHSGMYLAIWAVQVGNETYYTMDQWERWEPVYIPETGETLQKPYFTDLNGTKVYFDWERKPANWVNEIHVPIPGTNYTRFIPFTWTMQPVFDTVYIFNITIPEDPLNPGHTGVFYENHTEVAVNATFKVFGTIRGPGTRGDFDYSGGNLNRAWLPGVEAPWNEGMFFDGERYIEAPLGESVWVQYFTTLEGTRLYSESFGWDDGQQRWLSSKRWDFNGDPTSANITVSALEGGYAVYLNDTIKVDVTTQWPQGGWPNQYLIMENGTYFNVQQIPEIGRYITVIDGKTYLFRGVITYYNVTVSGNVYNIADPLDSDRYQYRHILTPNMYNVPTISTDRSTWLWMNATSDVVLHDAGYYLMNASDSPPSRLDLGLVKDWWTLPESVWRDMFRDKGLWELEEGRPRYNITINGQEYFVVDPSPVRDRWDGEWTVEQNTYRYPTSIDVTLGGTTYTIDLFDAYRNWKYIDGRRICRRYETITLNGTKFEVEEQGRWKPAYCWNELDVHVERMNIYKKHTMWGEVYRWMLTDLDVHTVRTTWDLVVGKPEWGMWGMRVFDIVPETGAVDLDGDLTTTDDQYFVRRIHGGSDMWNQTENRMFVEMVWDPNASMIDDEMHIAAWMGKVHVVWKFEWNETYNWYYASNASSVSQATMEQINATLTDSATGLPNPGYWDIAHMAKNFTWADVLARAEREHWDWFKDNTNEWEWIWFGTQQDYMTSWIENNTRQMAGIGLRYELAGLFLYNNTNSQQTHFFMPKSVGNITFVTPGEAFGNTNATGEMVVSKDETITFGFTCTDVNGTLFPFSEQRSMWGWWDKMIYGADFDAPDFTKKPTESAVDEMTFVVHFSANATENGELNNEASMKIDQHIGNWELDHNVIDGDRQDLRGNDVLLNRSLAINYYVVAATGIAWDVKDEEGSRVDNNNATESSKFDVAAKLANASFASVKLGSTYDWGKPVAANDTIRTLNVTSKTTPIGSFKASFESESGKSSTGFDISAMMYFLTVGFPRWDGYAVHNDPEVSFFISRGALAPPGGGPIWTQWWFWVFAGSVAAVAAVLVVFRARVKSGLSRLWRSVGSALHRENRAKGAGPHEPPRPQEGAENLG